MATPVVQSSNTAGANNAASLTITKPTGLSVGDLLVANLAMYDATSDNRTFTTPSGWTLATKSTEGGPGLVRTATFFKEADSSDAAASNFTFAFSGAVFVCVGYLARITGSISSNPITQAESDDDNTTTTTPVFTTSLTPDTPTGSLLLFSFASSDSDSTPDSVSGYTSTPSATWTEEADVQQTNTNDGVTLGVASAPYDSATAITSRSAVFSQSNANHAGDAMVIRSPIDASDTLALTSATVTSFPPTGSADTNHTLNFMEVSNQTAFTPNGQATAPTQWTNQSEESTTWTNESL